LYRILRYRNCLNYITFISVFTKEDTSRLPAPVTYTNIKCSDVNFTISDVYEKLAKLCPDKAAGPDNLSPRFLLQIKDYVTNPLYLLFRKSLDEGTVPTDWKNANISPIYKKGSRNKAENYQPISLTSQICKLFESIIRDTVNIVNIGLSTCIQHRTIVSDEFFNVFAQSTHLCGFW